MAPDVKDAPATDDKESASSVVMRDGEIVRDFVSEAEASAQAKALGKGAHVVHSGVAFHVADKDE